MAIQKTIQITELNLLTQRLNKLKKKHSKLQFFLKLIFKFLKSQKNAA